MVKIPTKGAIYKTSRISYIPNYLILILFTILLLLISPFINITLTPRTTEQLIHTLTFFGFLLAIAFLAEEPAIEQLIRHYIITNHEVIKVEGIFTKKKVTIPYGSVADILLHKSFLGRIFNYGTVQVKGFKEGDDIRMKGLRNPEIVHNILKNKISLMRETMVKERKQE